MRTLSTIEQEDRKRTLLQAVIHQYIKTGKPVGSAFVADQKQLDLSPATIRNIMSELEREGFLTHPHTSAGRVPTDKAYRFYVDTLAELQRLAMKEEERLRRDYETRVREVDELMSATSRTLSALSQFTGFVMTPGIQESRLQHVEMIPLDARRLLAVLVSDTGMVKHRQVVFDRPYSREFLSELTRLLNERVRGRSFAEVKDSLLDHIEAVHQRHLDLIDIARHVTEQAFEAGDDGNLYLDGARNILALPDFSDREDIRSLAHLLDERRSLGRLLEKDLSEDGSVSQRRSGVRVRIGAENKSPDLRNLSLVTSTYELGGRRVGVLGIIGPKRMEYSRMISLVNHVARVVSTP